MIRQRRYWLLGAVLVVSYQACSPGFDSSSSNLSSVGPGRFAATLVQGFDHKLVDSSKFGYHHAYAPTIIYDRGAYHAYYCSSGLDLNFNGEHDWDSIRYVTSVDGLNWSDPVVAVKTTNFPIERCACDPSIVYFKGMYYLFYSGNSRDRQTVMFVARSKSPQGPFAKWDGVNWTEQSIRPQVIIGPLVDVPDKVAAQQPWYGTGQQSVVVVDDTLLSWFTDDTANYPASSERKTRIYFGTSRDAVNWTRVETNVTNASSIDVKYDEASKTFVMFEMKDGHAKEASIIRRQSQDGINWTEPETICDSGCAPDYVHNIGVSGNKEGHLLEPSTLIAFGAPFDLRSDYGNEPCKTVDQENCWGRWDLYGGVIPTTFAVKSLKCTEEPKAVSITRAEAKTVLSGWSVDAIRDGNATTSYSSNLITDPKKISSEYIAVWFDGRKEIRDLHIGARTSGGVVLGFPAKYRIYATNADNGGWALVGEYQHQPGEDGFVHLVLPRTYTAYGVMIVPVTLKAKDPAGSYFQLSEVSAVSYDRACESPD